MAMERVRRPPAPSTPNEAPWTQAEEALALLAELSDNLKVLPGSIRDLILAIKSLQVPAPAVTVTAPGVPPITMPALPAALLPLMASIEDKGTSSGGSETSLIDNSKYWETDVYAGAILLMSIGGTLVITSISSNTHDTLTFAALPGGVKPIKTPYAIKAVGLSPHSLQEIIDDYLTKVATKVLDIASLAASATSALADCTAINLSVAKTTLAITVGCTFHAAAVAGIKVHLRSSYDGVNYDTQDFDSWTPTFTAGATIRATKVYDISAAYLKILIENLDAAQAVTSISVQSTVRGL